MSEPPYIHGTSRREQQRLIQQAAQLAELLQGNLELHPGERLLEIGCGVGAVLGQIGQSNPGSQLVGIDISPDQIEAMLSAFVAHFNRHGNAHAGPALGPWLEQAGFTEVHNAMVGIHHWCPSRRDAVDGFCSYLLGFIEPERSALLTAAPTPHAAALIQTGLEQLARLAERPDGAISISAYQARGMKSADDQPG
jgi:SAM-dependent methyltransferase